MSPIYLFFRPCRLTVYYFKFERKQFVNLLKINIVKLAKEEISTHLLINPPNLKYFLKNIKCYDSLDLEISDKKMGRRTK